MEDLEQFINKLKEESKTDEEIAQLVSELINSKDVELKTQIDNPVLISLMDTLADYLADRNLQQSSNLIANLLFHFRVNMVSYKRKSREEYIKALIGVKEEEKEKQEEILKKLLGK